MFDFGFWELALVLIISLIILGPERLPVFASQLGSWIKKIKDFANNVKTNIEMLRMSTTNVNRENTGKYEHLRGLNTCGRMLEH